MKEDNKREDNKREDRERGDRKREDRKRKDRKRIEIIDGLRGLAVSLMVIHHMLYNLTTFLGAPRWIFSNPVFDFLQAVFIGVFLFLSGVSSRFSRSNIRRGLITLALAVVISAATYVIGMPIWFGILHLLGFCMLFFGVTKKLWDVVPRKAAPAIFITLTAGSALARRYYDLTSGHLWVRNLLYTFGWPQSDYFDTSLLPWQPGFVIGSFDYQPLLPWIFVFLLGTWAGLYIAERKLPDWFYEKKVPFFPVIGRKALLIYVLHQPVMYGIVMGILCVTGTGV